MTKVAGPIWPMFMHSRFHSAFEQVLLSFRAALAVALIVMFTMACQQHGIHSGSRSLNWHNNIDAGVSWKIPFCIRKL